MNGMETPAISGGMMAMMGAFFVVFLFAFAAVYIFSWQQE